MAQTQPAATASIPPNTQHSSPAVMNASVGGGGVSIRTLADPFAVLGPGETPLEEIWDEQTCAASLAHLQDLQEQLHRLKEITNVAYSTILQKDVPPETYTRSLTNVYSKGCAALSDTVEQWSAPMTQEIFSYSARRRAADPDMMPSLEVPALGWKYDPLSEDTGEQTTPDERPPATKREEVGRIILDFKTRNPTLPFDISELNGTVSLKITVPMAGFNPAFTITYPSTGEVPDFNVTCSEQIIGPSTTRFLKNHARSRDLEELLNTISSYALHRGGSCVGCGKLLGADWLIPVGRVRSTADPTGWVPIHLQCYEP